MFLLEVGRVRVKISTGDPGVRPLLSSFDRFFRRVIKRGVSGRALFLTGGRLTHTIALTGHGGAWGMLGIDRSIA